MRKSDVAVWKAVLYLGMAMTIAVGIIFVVFGVSVLYR